MEKSKKIGTRTGFWVVLVAAIALEAISCVQYFTSRSAIKYEAEQRAKTELRKAELEIELHTVEMETAAKALALMVEKHVDNPDAIFEDTRLAVSTIREKTSLAVAYIPDYFPKKGRFYEVCSSRISEDSIYTRQIGSAEHDYTEMEWFQNGLKIDSCWWSEPYLDDSGSKTYVVSCSYPIRNKVGEVVAVVCVDLSLGDLKNLSDYLQVYPNSYYAIRSGSGVDMVPIPDTVPGRKYTIYQEEIDATGWHIEIIIPEEELFRDLNRIGKIVGILMLLGLGLLLFIVIRSGQSMQRLVSVRGQQERVSAELEIARNLQMALLPKNTFSNIYGFVQPAKEVGGDLYDFYTRDNKLFFCIGDVSGKGVPASLVMAITRSLFRSVSAQEDEVATIMAHINDAIVEDNDYNMFVTLFIGVLDLKTGEMNYCNAGHNAPVLAESQESRVKSLEVIANLPIGVMAGFEYRAQQQKIQRGDTLFLYTDGLTEAENKQHELFGEERMMKTIEDWRLKIEDSSLRGLVEAMLGTVSAFVNGAEQSDDLTMLAIRYEHPSLVMRNDIQQIPTLAEWVEGLDIPVEMTMPINLALEEAVTNVMLYAYPGRNDGKVYVEYERQSGKATHGGDKLIFTISDSGIPFDPTQAPEADTTLPAEERAIGGLGIHLVRKLMDKIHYQRKEGRNVLTLVKTLNC